METVIRITKKTTGLQLEKMLSGLKLKRRKINLKKYAGKITFGNTDGLAYQKQVRNEW